MSFLAFAAGNISSCRFSLGQAKPPFSWFVRVTAQARAIARTSCQGLSWGKLGWSFCPFWVKEQKVTILELFTLVSQSLSHVLDNIIASVFIMDWKLKFCLRNSISGSFGGQNVVPGLVKNDKNIFFFDTRHLTSNSVLPKKEVFKSHSLLTH